MHIIIAVILLVSRIPAAQTDGDGHDAGAAHEQSADRHQDEPREVEAQERGRILALAERADRLVAAVRTVVDPVTDQVRVYTECGQGAPKVLARVL